MDVREKYVMQKVNRKEKSICPNCIHHNLCIAENNQPCFECNRFIDANGVTVQEWISVDERTPTEADGTVWVCLADVFPYNEKEPYIDAKHDRRITEAFYSQFSKRWYKDGAVFPDGVVTHWMEKPQPPKGE